ncbi:sigma-70 family RNA polymerase sigma factor [Rhodoligotrophos defluvii]|uniref:sigma-70 family RNA polymerase sigma factor n=1 Tax=Rhodoligotrophos defluvii TaxID=2561934 RepID=UPI0010C97587|nr:sigma-70 family RNA polymerase sigma factor [Rhodoligotrophos defluvii]
MVALLPRLRAFALALSRSRTDADDLVQAACERALSSLSTYREGTNFDAWMMRILRNLWIDGYRRRKGEVLIDITDPVHDPVGQDGRVATEARMALNSVRQAIETLPEEQRAVLVLVCVDGLSYRDAAHVLDAPIGTVMSRLARARASLANALEGNAGLPLRPAGREAAR